MSDYVLPHNLEGEQQRLALMSHLLDPMERGYLERLGLQPGWRCLEVGCGNGSISQWLAERVKPDGHVVASDLDLRYIYGIEAENLGVCKINILEDPVEQSAYDLVTARAVLHHIPSPEKAVERMISALKPGGVILSVEPDMLPATVAEPESARVFWQGWLKWSVSTGIDYSIGRKMSKLLSSSGLTSVGAEGRTDFFNGGSPWATYWVKTLAELRPKLLASGFVTEALLAEYEGFLADPSYWTSVITFTAAWGRKPS